jgi:hypothetical protein
MNPDERDKDLNNLILESKTLFGDIEEMERDELLAVLDDSGTSANGVRHAMFLSLEALVKDFRLRGESPPQRYTDALNQLRPPSQISHSASALVQQAKKLVAQLLSGPRTGSLPKLQVSFHHKGELTQSDKRILEETEAELSRRMKLTE